MCEPKIIWRTDLKLSLLYPRTYTSVKCYLKSPCSLDKLKPSSAVQESFQVNSRRSKDPLQNEDKKILFLDLTTRFCAGAILTAYQTWWRLVSHVQYVSQIQLKSEVNHLLYHLLLYKKTKESQRDVLIHICLRFKNCKLIIFD